MNRQGARNGNAARANSRKDIDIPGVISDIHAIAFPSHLKQDSVDEVTRCGFRTLGCPRRRKYGTGSILKLRRRDADNGNAARIAAAQVMRHTAVAAFGGVTRHRRAA